MKRPYGLALLVEWVVSCEPVYLCPLSSHVEVAVHGSADLDLASIAAAGVCVGPQLL